MPSGEVVAAAEYGMPGAGGAAASGGQMMGHAGAGSGYGGSGAGASAWGAPSPMPSSRGYAYGDARSTPSAVAAAASPAPFGAWDAAPGAAAAAAAGAGSHGGWDAGSAAGGGWDAGSAAPSAGADGWGAPATAASAASAGGWGATPGPATPGGLPQTPGGPSLPQTPGAWGAPDSSSSIATPAAADINPSTGGGFFAWAVPRAMVVLASGQRGTIREVARERQQAIVQLEASAATQVIDRASVARLDPRPVRAEKRDRVIVIRGARRGALGTMVGKDGAEAFFQPDGDAAWHSEPLRNLAVYSGGGGGGTKY
ncbi:hypothetical protein H4S06_003024 [Coemansia sp. BCRC 34490]|nr:hypothetical protein H4S06_003024 [Coemansia sp. BCRC 34490]